VVIDPFDQQLEDALFLRCHQHVPNRIEVLQCLREVFLVDVLDLDRVVYRNSNVG
jgi:hypothetical protein